MEKFVKLGLLMLSYLESEAYTGRLLLTDAMRVMTQPTDGTLEEAFGMLSTSDGTLDVPSLLAAAKKQLFSGSSDDSILSLVEMVRTNNIDGLIETLLHIDFAAIGPEEKVEGQKILESLPPAFKGLVNAVTKELPTDEDVTENPVVSVDSTTKLFNQITHGQQLASM